MTYVDGNQSPGLRQATLFGCLNRITYLWFCWRTFLVL